MHKYETTIKNSFTITGIGLHTGESTMVVVEPAPAGSGIIFFKMYEGKKAIQLRNAKVVSTNLSVSIANGGSSIRTVEHILSAVFALDITNLYIKVFGSEVPILDGSSCLFVRKFEEVGVQTQLARRKIAFVMKEVMVEDEDRFVSLKPRSVKEPVGLKIDLKIAFHSSFIGQQGLTLEVNQEVYKTEISKARTFGFLKDVSKLRALGLVKGANMSNAVVVGDDGVLNPEGLRFDDEFVRHKALDVIGDLAVAGYSICANYTGFKPGHTLDCELVKKMLDIPGVVEIKELEADIKSKEQARHYAML